MKLTKQMNQTRDLLLKLETMDLTNFWRMLKSLQQRKPKQIRTLIKCYGFWNKAFFAKTYLQHLVPSKFGVHHREIFAAMSPGARGVRRADAAPRGGGKTNIYTASIIHHVVYKEYYELLGLLPNDFIVVIGESNGGYDVMGNVAAELETNELLIKHFGDLVGKTWGKERRITTNDCCLIAKSRNERIRGLNYKGKRPRFVLITDIQKPLHVYSPTQRRKDVEWLQQDVSRLSDNEGMMNLMIEGTILHDEALLAVAQRNPAYRGKRYAAIEKWSDRPDLWEEWKTIFTDLTNEGREDDALTFYQENRREMDEGVKLLWPEGISYYQCMVQIATDGIYAFQKEMQQNPEDEERQVFDMKTASYFSVVKNGLLREDGRLVEWEDLAGVSCFLDWAGGKDTQQNCFAAVIVVAWEAFSHTEEMYRYAIEAWVERKPPSAQVAQCFDYFEKYVGFRFRLGFESATLNQPIQNSLLSAVKDEKQRRKREGRPFQLSVQHVQQREEKFNRISKMEPLIANGWLCFNRALPQEFFAQMRQFPIHEFVDGPDALHGALQMPVRHTIKTAKHDEWREDRDEMLEFGRLA